MTTQSWNFSIDHQSDAGFQAWGADFCAKLDAIGLVQTADTGQVDWGTVARPANNTTAGYEMRRFDDTQQTAAPIYLKFDFGTMASPNRPRWRVSIGTGSDGSGNLTGVLLADIECNPENGFATGQSLQNFFSLSDGFLGLIWGHDGIAANCHRGAFVICRTCDADGVPDARAAWFYHMNKANFFNAGLTSCTQNGSINFGTGAVYNSLSTASSHAGIMPGFHGGSSEDGAGNTQAYPLFAAIPQMALLHGMCTVWRSDIGVFGTFTAAVVGSTPRTWLNYGGAGGLGNLVSCYNLTTNYILNIGHCMLWEA